MKKVFKFIYLILLIIFICGCNTPNISNDGYTEDLKVYFINVGQADCTFIMLPNDETILIDAGLDHATSFGESDFDSWGNIQAVLTLENINEIDHIVITHPHTDHYYHITDVIENYKVNNIYHSGTSATTYSYLDLLNTIYEYKIPMHEVYMGQNIIQDKNITFQVLYTLKQSNPEDANYCSVVTKLTYENKSFLFMGDGGYQDGDVEPALLQMKLNLKSDVLKVGHHGSTYSSSSDFMNVVVPEYAVITCAKVTSTGHPHRKALERISMRCKNILQSRNDGTILFITNGIDMNVTTHIGE